MTQSLFQVGWDLYRSGQHAGAANAFRQLVDQDPRNPELHHLLGLCYFRLGELPEAERCYRAAISLHSGYSDAHSNLGIALALQGKKHEAVAAFQAAIAAQPASADAHNNLGNACHELGRIDQAKAAFQEALRLNPNHPDALRNLGSLLLDRGDAAAALATLQRANQLRPNNPELLGLLGAALAQVKKHEEAAKCFSAVLAQQPNLATARNGMGIALAGLKRLDEAIASFREALRLQPNFPEAYNNMGNSLRELGRLDDSCSALEEAIRLRSDYAEAYNNLGITVALKNHLAEACRRYSQAIEHNPEHADAHKNLGLTLLKLGDFQRGWREFEWRWKCRDFTPRKSTIPAWEGEPLEGKAILLYAEQGFGDTIQFVRYAPLFKARGARVTVECQAPLVALIKSCAGIDEVIAAGATPPVHDFELPFMSLPRVFETTVDTVPASTPYLAADPHLVERWRKELADLEGFKIGIVWQGSKNYISDNTRSFPLQLFEPLARVAGIRLISLQKGLGSEQIAELGDLFSVTDLGPRIDLGDDAFVDTAAVMKNLDLVITADTATGHLSGALGVPVWTALAFSHDYRWLFGREDSPWYPTVRLFRQDQPGAWGPVFERMASALSKRVAQSPRSRPIFVEVSPGELIWRVVEAEVREEMGAAMPVPVGDLPKLRRQVEEEIPGVETVAALATELREFVSERVRVMQTERLQGRKAGLRSTRMIVELDDRIAALIAEINGRLEWSE
jgi:tetratricopeptide (TPR) repeat protein